MFGNAHRFITIISAAAAPPLGQLLFPEDSASARRIIQRGEAKMGADAEKAATWMDG